MTPAESTRLTRGLAAKLDKLIKGVQGPGGRPGVHVLAQQIRDATGISISGTYLNQLASGRRDNPTVRQLEALATFFGVEPSYFLDEATPENGGDRLRPDLAAALRDRGVEMIALRADGLSADSQRAILSMIDQARRIEQIDVSDDDKKN
ncbi:helix-turn-helix domain-containing protein [Amycolatopsis anabasis]|uniref:helix-turn-helix domain-containing protein n=1 Tax=Amycolatopsis anabasis TaxID=1840409 RepID=UPI00131C20A0|nr:XRE family transcriptional regulator [Amycolatopsis anabasis]